MASKHGHSQGANAPRSSPQVEVRFALDGLSQAANRRIEQVIKVALQDELSKQPQVELAKPFGGRTTTGIIAQDRGIPSI